jgi:tRNA-dihydrouridine synthase 4
MESTLLSRLRAHAMETRGKPTICIIAPMVRYGKLPFRLLCRRFVAPLCRARTFSLKAPRRYGCDLAFTPMIIAESFNRSERSRHLEFATNDGVRCL